LLGDGLISTLKPNGAASTSYVPLSSPVEGEFTIYALIDPDGEVSEALESNNRISKDFTVLVTAEDNTPPVVDAFEINNGKIETLSREVTVSVSATDPIIQGPYTGVDSIYLIEYEYNEGAATWLPVQASDWLTYTSSPFTFDWSLMPSAGIKYLQVWAADAVGNISATPRSAFINYMLAAEDFLANASRYYIYPLEVGEGFSTSLTPAVGDPDLYVWPPSGETPWYSLSGSGIVDEVTFVTPQTGRYVVQVYGYTDATYFLEVGVNGAAFTDISQEKLHGVLAKVPLSEPGLAPEKIPENSLPYAVPPAPVDDFPILFPGEYWIFLPLTQR
jgi:hypothetical protein